MDTIEALVHGVQDLIPLPKSYLRVQELVNDPESSIDDITKVIVNDTALTSRILHIANSGYLGLISKVDTIGRAVQVLGLNQVHDLALADAAVGSLTKISSTVLDVNDFWRRSVYCAVVSRLVSKQQGIGAHERLFVSGLLHDTGHLLLAYRIPEQFEAMRRKAVESATPMFAIEREDLGFDYADLGAALLANWKLPEAIVKPVSLHTRDLANIDSDLRRETSVLHIGATICRAAMWRSELDEPVPDFDPLALQINNIDSHSTESLMNEADEAVIEAMTLLLPKSAQLGAKRKTAA
jgi:HD-like signal output (HDOD) protein